MNRRDGSVVKLTGITPVFRKLKQTPGKFGASFHKSLNQSETQTKGSTIAETVLASQHSRFNTDVARLRPVTTMKFSFILMKKSP